MLQHPQLDAALVAVMAVGLLGYFWNRNATKKAIGARGVQFAGVCLMIPGVVLLALEGKLSECSTGTIVGAFAGYLFSGINGFDDRKKDGPAV
jgi:hypothetical protein